MFISNINSMDKNVNNAKDKENLHFMKIKLKESQLILH